MTDTKPEIELTRQLHTHMRGAGFATRIDDVLANGKPTDIMLRYRTKGPPNYEYVEHELVFRLGKDDEERLDLLAKHCTGTVQRRWIEERL